MTVLILVFAEVLPKTLAILRPDDVARWLSGPTEVSVFLFAPVVNTVQAFVRGALRLFRGHVDAATGSTVAHEEIRGAVEYHHSEGSVEGGDRRMLGGVLDLADMDVAEIMVHRKSIAMLDADLPRASWSAGPGRAATPACRSIGASRRTSSACCTPRTCCAPWPRSRAASMRWT